MWVSRRRRGSCVALQWSAAARRYQCDMVADPGGMLGWRRPWAVGLATRLARRWIAEGIGCDAHLEMERLPP